MKFINKKLIYLCITCIILFSYSTFAYDLSEYPSPFIKNNKFDGVVVVGDKAGKEEVIGASDILVSMIGDSKTDVKFQLKGNGDEITDTLEMGQRKVYNIGNKNYEVYVYSIGKSFEDGPNGVNWVAFEINGDYTQVTEGKSINYGDLLLKADEIHSGGVAIVVKLASEISDIKSTNAILVGGPCSNTATATIMGNPSDCLIGFKQGVGIIEAFENNGKVALVVAGYSDSDIKNAAEVLTNYQNYENLRGSKVEVRKVNNKLIVTPPTASAEIAEEATQLDKQLAQKPNAIVEDTGLRLDFGLKNNGKFDFSTLVIIFVTIILLSISVYGILKFKKRPKKEKVEEETTTEPNKSEKPSFVESSKEAISVSNFTLKHGKNIILENVDIDITKGEMVCLLGPSGTGKSTIIEALVGRKTPTKGTLKILGQDISKNKKIYDYVGFVPQNAELYMNQTVMQNLLSSATKWGVKDAKNRAEKILSKIGLSERKDLKASKLSGGQQKLLSLAMELIRDIEVCILDEPTTGLDPNTRNNIITILSQISTQLHKTIFFTTHFMDDAEECDNVIILSDKKIVAQGPPSKLEKMLPGGGKVINVILDNVTDDLLEKIEKIEGIKKIVREGRNLRILTDEPNAIKLGQKIDEIGGVVNETKIDKATMMEVFVYYTGKEPEK